MTKSRNKRLVVVKQMIVMKRSCELEMFNARDLPYQPKELKQIR